jgi:tryptophan-rich sensory protein
MLLHKSLGVAALSTTKWLILHLCIGDMWNAINNVEGRLGFSALTVVAVLTSVINATNKYYGSLPLAGYLLGGTCVWLTIATGLIWNTWWINKRGVKRDYLLPMKESGEASPTRFIWEKAS